MHRREINIRPLTDSELDAAFELMQQLRRPLTPELFRERLARQRAHGYQLIGAFTPALAGLLGMRPVETMARGYHLHVDDLIVVAEARALGIGRRLLDYAEAVARGRGMVSVFLDSRPEALGFYVKLGYGPHTATLVRKLL